MLSGGVVTVACPVSGSAVNAEDTPGVRVHVASFNTSASTELCIRTLRTFAGYPFELVVGDCGSTDSSPAMLESLAQKGWLSLETAPEGRQHAQWLDHWLATCSTPLAVFVDSDVEFLRPGWLSDLVATLRSRGAAAVSAELLPESANFIEPVGGKTVRLASRLAPWLLAIDVAKVKALGTSFAFRAEETSAVPEGLIAYDVGAWLLRALETAGHSFAVMDEAYRKKFHHYGGLSWLPLQGRRGRRKTRDLRRIDRKLQKLRC
ncbi:MAG: hypothetical protein NVSMB32_08430 [Actinomycetota bacterium]